MDPPAKAFFLETQLVSFKRALQKFTFENKESIVFV
jgi:hypothetical protein